MVSAVLSPCLVYAEAAPETERNARPAVPLFKMTENQWIEFEIGSGDTLQTAREIEEQKTLENLQVKNINPVFEYLPEPLNEFRLRYRIYP